MRKKSFFTLILAMMVMILVACGKGGTETSVSGDQAVSTNETVSANDAIESVTPTATPEVKDEKTVSDNKAVSDNSVSDNSVSANDAKNDTKTDDKDKDAIDRSDIEAYSEAVTMYAQSGANIRKGPGTTNDIVGSLSINDSVEVVGKCKSVSWYEIKHGDGTAFVYCDLLGKEEVDLEALKAAQEAAAAAAAAQAAAQPATQPAVAPVPAPAPAPAPAGTGGVLFIGDSRTCQMQQYTGGSGCGWICQYGAKYDWFESTGAPQADAIITAGTKVVICMGVNDPDRCSDYANLVNRYVWNWVGRGAKVYYVSVNPVEEPYIAEKAAAIDSFNASMPGRLQGGVVWIDTASVIKQNPAAYPYVDGIHFDANANIAIFRMIYGCLR